MATVTVSLPSDGTTADVGDYNTPITTIVGAINGGLDNTNIATGAAIATSKLADDAGITATKLAPSAIKLGYAQITSSITGITSTTAVQLTGLTVTVTVPAGGRSIKITAFTSSYNNGSASLGTLSIWDGTVGSGTQIGSSGTSAGASTNPNNFVIAMAIVTPAAGSKTYNVGGHVSTGTGTFTAATTSPAFILVEAI